MKILIVDDDKSMRSLLRGLCEDAGHSVVGEFESGDMLIEHIRLDPPDVVCLDYHLPGASGLELLVEMDAKSNDVDVIMITASDDPELKGHAADLGARGFIRKPFEQSQIIDELKVIEEARSITARAATARLPELEPRQPGTAGSGREGEVVPRSAVIIDDSGSIRLLLKGILTGIDVRVTGMASSGREGIEVARRTRPALICLDVDMPGMTGIEALPEIRAASPGSKVVMITGNASRAIVEAAVAGGAKGYFLKPIRPAKVEEFFRKLLER